MNKKWMKPIIFALCGGLLLGGGIGVGLTKFTQRNGTTVISGVADGEKTTVLDSNAEIFKDETVYVLANTDGTVKKVIVSDWIKNTMGLSTIEEKTEMKDVENVGGDETYTMGGENTRIWDAQGNDIYYQGNIEKELPVGLTVSYQLDGKTISAEDLAGKSGKVTIRYDYTNYQSEIVSIDGKEEKIYVPFVMVTGMLLDNKSFRNIEVSNGKIINDGTRCAVIGFALPGLQDNLAIPEDQFEFPASVEITADVTDFEMTNTVTIATNSIFSELDSSALNSLDDLTSQMDQLTGAMNQLLDGSSTLYNGLSTLLTRSRVLVSGIHEAADGAGQLQAGVVQINDGVGQINNGLQEVKSGMSTIASHNDEIKQGSATVFEKLLSTAEQQMKDNGLSFEPLTINNYHSVITNLINNPTEEQLKNVISAANTTLGTELLRQGVPTIYVDGVKYMLAQQIAFGKTQDQAMEYIKTTLEHAQLVEEDPLQNTAYASDALTVISAVATSLTSTGKKAIETLCKKLATENLNPQLSSALDQLDTYATFYYGLGEYIDGVTLAADGVNQLTSGAGELQEGTDIFSNGFAQLCEGLFNLDSGAPELIEGATNLKNGAMRLSNGLQQLNEQGIKKLTAIADGDLGNVLTRLKATIDVSKDYKSFTGISDTMGGQVKFIYKTDSIKK